jgi:hypothetical protein
MSRLTLSEQRDGKPLVRWFLVYAHNDRPAPQDFLAKLVPVLRSSQKYTFDAWHDGMIVVGETWRDAIHGALREAHLGILLVSYDFLASEFIMQVELPAFVSGSNSQVPGKRLVPVALKLVDFEIANLKGLDKHQIFRDDEGKAFVDRQRARRETWIRLLVKELHVLLDRYADYVPPIE